MNIRNKLDFGGLRFIDLIFNLLMVMTVMFILAFIHMSKNDETGEINLKESYLIIMEWNHKAKYDIDLHMTTPDKGRIFFNNKHHTIGSLERDDLGSANDTAADGTILELNREVIYVRRFMDGFYVINVHFYSNSSNDDTKQDITVEIVKLNPYRVIFRKSIDKELALKEEITAVSFLYDSEKDLIYDIDENTQYNFIKSGR